MINKQEIKSLTDNIEQRYKDKSNKFKITKFLNTLNNITRGA